MKIIQKGQKHVISLFLILLIFNCEAQTNIDDYSFLNKTILLTKKDKSAYKLNENKNANKNHLQKYYDFRYLNKPIFRIVEGFNEENDSIIYDNKSSKKLNKSWNLQYSILDKVFSKEDIEHILKQVQKSKWDTTKLDDNIEVMKTIKRADKNRKNFNFRGNTISEPLYSIDKKHAIIQHHSAKTFTTLFVFKKDGDDWVKIGSVENLW